MSAYEGFQQDWDDATEKFTLTREERTPDRRVQWVEAQAGTGSRYVVCLTRLGEATALTQGADFLVSVMHPVAAVYPISTFGPDDLHDVYLMEKFCRGLRHGGDQAGVCLTIREAVRLMFEEPEPEKVRNLGGGRWEIEGYDVVEQRKVEVWKGGVLLATKESVADARSFIAWLADRGLQ